ncbi:MAG: hypothetical protein MK102_12995 [Fuerstiella sp.]|nr:hypothetical protein [Fuerstiella sp.]
MSLRTSRVFVASLAVTAGVALTLLAASQFVQSDAELLDAQHRFANMEYSEARRIRATFDRLRNRPEEQQHIMTIHNAVIGDVDLDRRLRLLYTWWETRDDAQRKVLRTLSPNDWVTETQRQLSESPVKDRFLLRVPGSSGPIRVSRNQVDQFLQHALPSDILRDNDKVLLDSVSAEDRPLASVLIIAKRMVRRPSGNSRFISDEDAVARIFNAAMTHLLADRFPARPADSRRPAMICFSILRSLADHLAVDFHRRNSVKPEAIEQGFADLETPDRIRHMMMDPNAAMHSIQARLKSQDRHTPAGQLAARLAAFDRIGNDLRDKHRPGSVRAVRQLGGLRQVRPRVPVRRQTRDGGAGTNRTMKRRNEQ